MLKYCFMDGHGFFEIQPTSSESYHCIHIYIDNNKTLEIPYKKSNVFEIGLDSIPGIKDNSNLSIRYFTKNDTERNVFSEKLGRVSNLISGIININKNDIQNLSNKTLFFYLKYLFEKNENDIAGQCLYQLICNSTQDELIKIKDKIIKTILNFRGNDQDFLYGVFFYKIGDFQKAQLYFIRTKGKENSFDKIGKAVFLYNNSVKPTHKLNNEFTILISCDTGYLYAYKDNLIESLKYHELLIHIHVLVSKESSINEISNDFKKYNGRLNLSFEILTIQDKKVYSSISRFIVAKDIVEKYSTPILIADIDLDFSKDCVNSLKELNLNEIGLFINNEQLPWKKILAGFCYFPNTAKSIFFLENLSSYLIQMCDEGNYYWTLDQVALTNLYDSNILPKLDFHNFRESNVIRLKQVENRQAARRFSEKYKDY